MRHRAKPLGAEFVTETLRGGVFARRLKRDEVDYDSASPDSVVTRLRRGVDVSFVSRATVVNNPNELGAEGTNEFVRSFVVELVQSVLRRQFGTKSGIEISRDN